MSPSSQAFSWLSYLSQAIGGQVSLWNRTRPLSEVLRDPRTPEKWKKLLKEIPAIKKFGESQGLKPTKNYEQFVKLDGSAVVWVVSACPPLKFEPKVWKYPIVGGMTYAGWFERADAEKHGNELRGEGLDVHVRGAGAYSTLGWFNDPILSSMIDDGDEAFGELVNVVLHESVHATLYIPHQSSFNESLASFVADRVVWDYLRNTSGEKSPEWKAYSESGTRGIHQSKILVGTFQKLKSLYDSQDSDEAKLKKKSEILAAAQKELGWKKQVLNNALLVQHQTYSSSPKEFEELLKTCGGSWPRFLQTLSRLSEEDFPSRQRDDLASVLRLPKLLTCAPD